MSAEAGAAVEAAGRRVLYLSYDGMTDPLGGSQVLPYLAGLAGRGHRIHLISFEKPGKPAERKQVAQACEDLGIAWHPLRYTRRPPVLSTLYDVARLRHLVRQLHRKHRFELIHCRSYITPLAAEGLGVPFLFDMRALWADERAESGLWPQSSGLYRRVHAFFKRKEAEWLRRAAGVVSLTERARDLLLARPDRRPSDPQITVIPCCVDRSAFPPITAERRRQARALLGIGAEQRVAVSLGSLTGWYRLDRLLALFAAERRRHCDARLLVVTRDSPTTILAEAQRAAVPAEALIIRAASRDEVPLLVAAADYGVIFGKEGLSQVARSPVKLGEFMALELPVVTDRLIGDVERIVEESGCGVLLDRFEAEDYDAALDRLAALPTDLPRWRAATDRWFSLDQGVERYQRLYERAVTSRNN